MSLYPLWLDTSVFFKRLAINLHLAHPPHLAAPTGASPTLTRGLCARYEGGDDGSPVNLGVIRVAVKSADQLKQALASGAKIIALVETLDRDVVTSIGNVIKENPANLLGIELGNEIDLTSATISDFTTFILTEADYLRSIGFKGDIITGGISRVRPGTLNWLKQVLSDLPSELLVGIHRYSINNNAAIPQDGYVNRDEECNAIIEAVGGRQIAITEFGYPLLDGYSEPSYRQSRESIKVDLDYFSRMGVKYAIFYQWLCGPTNTPIDRFGLKRPDGTVINLDLLT